ncbi:MAG: glycosyltransferase, partial [Hymenobacteraceae bacterium]|nr:glycosyltransferase [Hymenobacteraceae bacterium]MDX5396387.1 glycosyltransferase [Hymenobacteraceae bacterium]MDX5512449.1 glycosyltransferase [Hymenobacteraceae bacterium]
MENILIYLLGASVAVQVVYALYYFLPFAFHKPKTSTSVKPVSVIVCAHNEVHNVQKLLPALLEQNYPEYELVLIDDRSWDGTGRYFEEVKHDFPETKLVKIKDTPQGMSPKKYALTLGIKSAKHEHLLFIDADCVPVSANWIHDVQSAYVAETEIVLGYSPYKENKGFLNQLIRFETLLTGIQYLSFAVRGQAYMGVGRNLSYTKSCFFNNKGFASHIKTISGDDDLFIKEAASGKNVNIVTAK